MKQSILLSLLLSIALVESRGQNPPTPTNLVAQNLSGTNQRVSLTWQVAPGQWYFKIYRSEEDTSNFESAGWSFSPNFQDQAVLLNHTYYYYVTSVVFHETTLVESPRSNIAHVTVNTSRPHGQIRGLVTSDANGQPIPNVRIRVFRLNLEPCWSAPTLTNPSGQYQVELDTGSYFIKAEPPWESPYRPEWYDNVLEPSAATPVHVSSNSSSVADFGLSSGSSTTLAFVHGVVREFNGGPLQGASVVFMRTMQEMNSLAATTGQTPGLGTEARMIPGLGYTRGVIWSGLTDQFGQYYAHVPAGESYIAAAAKSGNPGYMPEYFDGKTDPTQADIITVNRDTSDIDFFLTRYPSVQNSVRGAIRDSSGQRAPSRVILFPKPPGTQPPSTTRLAHSDTLGNYEFTHVVAGTYGVLAIPYSNFAPGFYKDNAYGVIHWQEADSIVVAGSVPNINVGIVSIMNPGLVRVSGTVTALNGSPIFGGRVVARTSDNQTVGYGVSDGTGSYFMDAMPAGQVSIFTDRTGYSSAQGTILIPPNIFTFNSNFVLGNNATAITEYAYLPYSFELEQSYPNPFNPTTTIRYSIPGQSGVVLKVFNVLGQEVATLVDEVQNAGVKIIPFDASSLPSGLYFYRLETSGFVNVKRMLLLK